MAGVAGPGAVTSAMPGSALALATNAAMAAVLAGSEMGALVWKTMSAVAPACSGKCALRKSCALTDSEWPPPNWSVKLLPTVPPMIETMRRAASQLTSTRRRRS